MKRIPIFIVVLFLSISALAESFFHIVLSGTPDQVREAIKAGADVNSRNNDDMTPLMVAAMGTAVPGIIYTLARQGADRNMMLSAMGNTNPEVISVLLSAGAKVDDYCGSKGATALLFAAGFNRNPGVINALLRGGAKIDEHEEEGGGTPLMLASSFNLNPEVITALLNNGASVYERDYKGWTPLMFAAQTNPNPEIIVILVAAGAVIDARAKDDRTALMVAARYNTNPEVVAALLKAGANAELTSDKGMKAIDYARAGGNQTGFMHAQELAGTIIAVMGELGSPRSVFVDSSDRIYITDSGNCRIVRIADMEGRDRVTYGSP
jgi:ankyrin repeat protein